MLRLLLTSIALISLCKSVHAEWILSSTSKLPRKSIKMTMGSYNDTIYILGDWDTKNNHPNGKQLIKYDISRDEFIDNGIDALPRKVYGETQYYTQIDNILYIIDYTGETLATYNMESDSFDSNYRSIPVTVNEYACLSSRSNYLYIVGGYDLIQDTDLDTVQVLDLTTNNWLNNVPSMLEPRTSPSCIVDESFMLYAIGGYIYTSKTNWYSPIASIERIDTNNIQQNSWSYREPLGAAGYGLRSVLHNNNIYIVGGANGDSDGWTYLDTVRMIDTATGTVSVSPDRLPYKVTSSANIIVDNILYAFGGGIGTSRFDTWMKYELPSATPTNDPTDNPSFYPTYNPSYIRTTSTNDPTEDPTYNPTESPLSLPTSTTPQTSTVVPSNIPSKQSISYPGTTQPETTVNNIQITRKLTTLQYTQAKSTNNEDSNEQNNGNPPNNKEVDWRLYIRIFVIVSLLAMFCFAVLYLVKRKMNTHKNKEIEDNAVLEMDGKQNIVLVDEDDVCVAQVSVKAEEAEAKYAARATSEPTTNIINTQAVIDGAAKLTLEKVVKVHDMKLDDDQQEGYDKNYVNDEQQLTIEGYDDEQQAVVDTNETTKGVMVDEQDVYTRGALDI